MFLVVAGPPHFTSQGEKMILYHATTPKKAKMYRESGRIIQPVRGFDTGLAAMAWALDKRRTVILTFESSRVHKLPDHHNKFGSAWWAEEDVIDWKCYYSSGEPIKKEEQEK
jgi:hypothetical protein